MGWSIDPRGLRRGETLDARMRSEMSWSSHDAKTGDKHEIIASATVGSTWYAALLVTRADERPDQVTALISLTTRRGGFGYKDMDETMGPNEVDCPKRILDMLTPTESEYALGWRKACHERLEAKRDARRTAR